MAIPEALLGVHTHAAAGYLPLVDFGAWRVALLNYSDDLRPENIKTMQRHDATDEVFVLLRGRCILFVGEGDRASISAIFAQPMQPQTIYNVRQSVWHTHSLSPDAGVLVVENRDTTYDNSPFCSLSAMQRKTLCKMASDHGI